MEEKTEMQHPGLLLKEYLTQRNAQGNETARLMKISRTSLTLIFKGKAAITPLISLKISAVFGDPPDKWVKMQVDYDLQQASKKVQEQNLPAFVNQHPKQTPKKRNKEEDLEQKKQALVQQGYTF